MFPGVSNTPSEGARKLAERLNQPGRFERARAGLNRFGGNLGSMGVGDAVRGISGTVRGIGGAAQAQGDRLLRSYSAGSFANNNFQRLRGASQMLGGGLQSVIGAGGTAFGGIGMAADEAAALAGRTIAGNQSRLPMTRGSFAVGPQSRAMNMGERAINAVRRGGANLAMAPRNFQGIAQNAANFTFEGGRNIRAGFNELIGGEGSRVAAATAARNQK